MSVSAKAAMVWMCDAQGHACLFNQSWLQFTGLSLSQALGQGWVQAVHPEDLETRLAAQRTAIETRQPFEVEYRLRQADGEYRRMLDQAAPQLSGGDFLGHVGVAVDVTGREQVDHRLRWLSLAMEQNPASVVITDLHGNIKYVNPKFTAVTGYTFAEVLGKNPRFLKSGEMPPAEYAALWQTIQHGEWRGEFHNKKKNGELFWESASICPIKDASGRPTHYLATNEDITDRKRAEQALQASEERFRMAVENAGDWIYEYDLRTAQVVIYGPGRRQATRSLEEWYRRIHPEDRERLTSAHGRHLQSGEPWKEVYRIIDRDGSIRHFSDRSAPVRDEQGRNSRWIGVLRDITEHKRAREAMARLAAIVQSSNDAMVAADPSGVFMNWNAAAEKLYGYPAVEMLGKSPLDTVAPEYREVAARNIAAVLRGEDMPPYEARHIRQDGSYFWVNVAASPIRDADGAVIGDSAIIRDISVQRRTQQALVESENRMRVLAENTSEAMTFIDPQGVILSETAGIRDLLGVAPDERIGRPAFPWIHPDDVSYVRRLHEELLREPGARMRAQFRMRHKDGSWRWCDSRAVNMLAEPGVQALVTSFRDITELKEVETALRESEQRYRRLIEDAADVIFSMDLGGNITSVNCAGEKISGYQRHELLGMNIQQLAAPEFLPAIRKNIKSRLAGGTPPTLEAELIMRNGQRCTLEIAGRLQFRNGQPSGILCVARDISERKHAERLDKNRRHALEMVAQNQPLEAILCRLVEMIEEYYPASIAYITLEQNKCAKCDAKMHQALAQGFQGRIGTPIRSGSGQVLGRIEIQRMEPWSATGTEQSLLDSMSKLASIALEHRELTNRLAYQAQHDPLTGLPNRMLLEDRLTQALALARRQGTMVAVVYIDLDRFKVINDTLGHAAGDLLLVESARRLEAAAREADTLARTGGDEFVAVLFGIEDAASAELAGERLVRAMREPFQIKEHELFVSASAGLSLFPRDGEDAGTLHKHADVAMYTAKSQGGNRFQQFAHEMNCAFSQRLEIESHLHHALDRNELVLYYQPLFHVSSGQLAGVEALLRWNHPTWGLVPPGRFVPLAEESGLILPIGQWVLEEACRQHRRWRQAGHPPVRIAVNVSAIQFARSNLPETVAGMLARYDVEPCYLDLELTEGVVMRDMADSARQLNALRELGVSISLDDFGTGYSSLSYLQRLPIDNMKIDKCFVQGIGRGNGTQQLVQAMVGLAHSLKMTATAEGVEVENELAALRTLGCDWVQGYLLGKPAPPDQQPFHTAETQMFVPLALPPPNPYAEPRV